MRKLVCCRGAEDRCRCHGRIELRAAQGGPRCLAGRGSGCNGFRRALHCGRRKSGGRRRSGASGRGGDSHHFCRRRKGATLLLPRRVGSAEGRTGAGLCIDRLVARIECGYSSRRCIRRSDGHTCTGTQASGCAARPSQCVAASGGGRRAGLGGWRQRQLLGLRGRRAGDASQFKALRVAAFGGGGRDFGDPSDLVVEASNSCPLAQGQTADRADPRSRWSLERTT